MRLIIGADIVPTKSNRELFINSKTELLIGGELKEKIERADFTIFNLEVPLTDSETPILKHGPVLSAPSSCINGYKALGVNLVTLANNHILDHGEQGLASTQKVLEDNGIAYLGAGINAERAGEPYIFVCDGKKIGVYACAEHEFSITENNKPGANPFDPLESPDRVAELKKQCDYVIVLYHGGKEHYRYPSPDLRKSCRKLAQKGADLVVCQHSHCVGCEEKYSGSTIVYGQGNFLFDGSESEYWKTGMLISIDDGFAIGYIPLVKQGETVRLADEEKAVEILDGFRCRSEEIKQAGVTEKKYSEFANAMLDDYLYSMSGKKSYFFRIINKLTRYRFSGWYLKRKYNKESLAALRNIVGCEAHRELLLCGLINRGSSDDKK